MNKIIQFQIGQMGEVYLLLEDEYKERKLMVGEVETTEEGKRIINLEEIKTDA